jgi:pyruvate,water dikinase
MAAPLPAPLAEAIERSYAALGPGAAVAVRSSATAEDLPEASFAGQQETFLNVCGIEDVLAKVHEVFASLFNDRAISYRVHHGFEHADVALSAGIQRMVRSDRGASGVMFTIDTESGFSDVVFITSSYGLGETVVQGAVNPDEYYVYKPALAAGRRAILRRQLGGKAIKMIYSDDAAERVRTVEVPVAEQRRFSLTNAQVESLARQAVIIERHYGRPMDIEWGLDGVDGEIYILQARPETVEEPPGPRHRTIQPQGQRPGARDRARDRQPHRQRRGARRHRTPRHGPRASGDVLVTDMTDPDWEPVMKIAGAIVTNRGGRTCHAAIIARSSASRPSSARATQHAHPRRDSRSPSPVRRATRATCTPGKLDFERHEFAVGKMPPLPVKIMMNVGNPDRAFDFAVCRTTASGSRASSSSSTA